MRFIKDSKQNIFWEQLSDNQVHVVVTNPTVVLGGVRVFDVAEVTTTLQKVQEMINFTPWRVSQEMDVQAAPALPTDLEQVVRIIAQDVGQMYLPWDVGVCDAVDLLDYDVQNADGTPALSREELERIDAFFRRTLGA
jgi:hypothetical protein